MKGRYYLGFVCLILIYVDLRSWKPWGYWVHLAAFLILWFFWSETGGQAKPQFYGRRKKQGSFLPTPGHDEHVPALGAAVVDASGQLVSCAVNGVRKAGEAVAVTAVDKFHLGSCTKSMTATLAGLLVDEGKLRWTTTMGEIFPDVHPGYQPVTLEQLLCHRGGVPSDLKPGGLWMRLWEQKGSPREQRAYLTRELLASPPFHTPGTRYLYSNAGYALIGAMLETLADKPWEALMQERLFQPLGMSSAGFGPPSTSGELDQPWGHVLKEGRPVPVPPTDNPVAIAPAGAVHVSLGDWARYAAFHLTGHAEKLSLTPASLEKLHVPGLDSGYAGGWIVTKRSWGKGEVLTHGGSNTMFNAVIWLAPKLGNKSLDSQ